MNQTDNRAWQQGDRQKFIDTVRRIIYKPRTECVSWPLYFVIYATNTMGMWKFKPKIYLKFISCGSKGYWLFFIENYSISITVTLVFLILNLYSKKRVERPRSRLYCNWRWHLRFHSLQSRGTKQQVVFQWITNIYYGYVSVIAVQYKWGNPLDLSLWTGVLNYLKRKGNQCAYCRRTDSCWRKLQISEKMDREKNPTWLLT